MRWTVLVFLILIGALAQAGGSKTPPNSSEAFAKNYNEIDVEANAHAKSFSEASASSESLSSANVGAVTTTNEGNNLSFTNTQQRSAPTIVNIPNNNTESCLRVWGLSFSNVNGGGGLGIPTRSAACDYDNAADDAEAQGFLELAWYYRCHKKSLQKRFGAPKMLFWTQHSDEAVEACYDNAMRPYGKGEQSIR